MSNQEDAPRKTDWTAIDQIVKRSNNSEILPSLPTELQPPTFGTGVQPPDARNSVQPTGVIASFKANAITRKAAVSYLQVYYERQLEAARHQLAEVVRVRKAESTAVAEQLLASINSQQMQFLVEVGLRNEGVRNRALIALNDQTSATLKQVVEADWPESLRTQAVDGIMDRNRKFFERLMTDLGEN